MIDGAVADPGRTPAPLLAVRDLVVRFPTYRGVLRRRSGWIEVVSGVSFDVGRGRTLGLVGESGSGKTTVAKSIMRTVEVASGSIILDGTDLLALGGEQLRQERKKFQMVFQDPQSTLNPRFTVERLLGEPLRVHGVTATEDELFRRTRRLLSMIGLDHRLMSRHPRELSGGQQQRVAIARAMAVDPSLVVFDEAVSSLDVSVQAQIINLLKELQEENGLTYVFIGHDLAVVRHFADEVAVMYLGKLMEIAPSEDLYTSPLHPYTVALLSAVPVPDATVERRRERIILAGDLPSPASPPRGCRFWPRCWLRTELGNPEICSTVEPTLEPHENAAAGHRAACHFSDELRRSVAPVSLSAPRRSEVAE